MLVASWDSLPLRTRNELIAFRWKDIKGPDMMPILRGIVDTPRDPRSPAPQPERGPALGRLQGRGGAHAGSLDREQSEGDAAVAGGTVWAFAMTNIPKTRTNSNEQNLLTFNGISVLL